MLNIRILITLLLLIVLSIQTASNLTPEEKQLVDHVKAVLDSHLV